MSLEVEDDLCSLEPDPQFWKQPGFLVPVPTLILRFVTGQRSCPPAVRAQMSVYEIHSLLL